MMQILKERFGIESLHKEPLTCAITEGFLLPIDYLQQEHVHRVHPTVLADLEYVSTTAVAAAATSTTDCDSGTTTTAATIDANLTMMDYVMGIKEEGQNAFETAIMRESAQKYTTHTEYLEQTQQIVKTIGKLPRPSTGNQADEFAQIWRDIKEDADFLNKHSFLEWKTFESLNKSKMFLQIYSFFNILSPMFSLMMPLVLMLLPFLLIKLQGIPITLQQYVITLREIAKSHFLGKALSIQDMSVESVLYFLFILAMYALQTYQNVMACIRYYQCVQRMNGNLCALYAYLQKTIGRMDKFVETYNRTDMPHYADFCQDVYSHKLVLEDVYLMIGGDLTPFCLHPRKLGDLGHMLHCYYQLYSDVDMEESLRYSAGFEGYYAMMWALHQGVQEGRLGCCAFVRHHQQQQQREESNEPNDNEQTDEEKENNEPKEDDKPKEDDNNIVEEEEEERQSDGRLAALTSPLPTSLVEEERQPLAIFHDQYYPPLFQKDDPHAIQKNTIDLTSQNIIITGVNASGKTTTLKSTAINILVSQQFGVGCYSSAELTPFHHIHSYLNIPDTSGRDSLFQAESRRCKEILDKIGETPTADRHFCLFDELYSGTNPKEATKSAISLLRFLASKTNVRFLLTTHYVDVCTQLEEDSRKSSTSAVRIAQYQMEVLLSTDHSIEEKEKDENKNKELPRELPTSVSHIEQYTYRLIPGISVLEGGIEILKNLNYPREILQDMLAL